ncbi:MAG: hypothetical protein RBS57_07615 [Desulforhabdus sp.]|jgi:hypothetical protein|nr:hypothetical protein [Desulforhabdus sp.]
MEECQRVVLYGDSLLLVAIRCSLAVFSSIEVITQNLSVEAALPDFCAMQASVVIFDLNEVPSRMVLSMIEKQPKLLIIGLEAAGERMLLLPGWKTHSMTVKYLIQLIENLLHEAGGEPARNLAIQ